MMKESRIILQVKLILSLSSSSIRPSARHAQFTQEQNLPTIKIKFFAKKREEHYRDFPGKLRLKYKPLCCTRVIKLFIQSLRELTRVKKMQLLLVFDIIPTKLLHSS